MLERGGASLDRGPANRQYEIIRRHFNDAKNFEQYSKAHTYI